MRNMLKTVMPLFVITLVASFLLGFVYDITKEPIERQKAQLETESVKRLLPDTADSQTQIVEDGTIVSKVITCSAANGQKIGCAILVSPKGFEGALDILVGFDTEGVIQGVEILSHSETPGLGANAALPAFTDQFKSKTGNLKVTKAKAAASNEIEAVTSATITSNAVTTGVNAAADYFNQQVRGGF